MVNLKNVSYLVMDDFYRNRSARLSDEIKRVVLETRVSILIYIYNIIFAFLSFLFISILSVNLLTDPILNLNLIQKFQILSS